MITFDTSFLHPLWCLLTAGVGLLFGYWISRYGGGGYIDNERIKAVKRVLGRKCQ